MIYWIRVHKAKHGDIEQILRTRQGLIDYLDFVLADGWTVVQLKMMNREEGKK